MSARRTDALLGTLLTVALGIAGAVLLAHWAACEQYEGLCAMAALLPRLTEAELDKRIADKAAPAGCTGDCRQGRKACDCRAPAHAFCRATAPRPALVPCSTLARLFLAFRRWW